MDKPNIVLNAVSACPQCIERFGKNMTRTTLLPFISSETSGDYTHLKTTYKCSSCFKEIELGMSVKDYKEQKNVAVDR